MRIMRIVGHSLEAGDLCVVMQRYSGSLATLLGESPNGRLDVEQAVQFGLQIFTCTLKKLHDLGEVLQVRILYR